MKRKLILIMLAMFTLLSSASCGKVNDASADGQSIVSEVSKKGTENGDTLSKSTGKISLEDVRSCPPSPQEDFNCYENDDGTISVGYDGDDEIVVVPEEIDGKKVTVIEQLAFANSTTIKAVMIPDSVVELKLSSFALSSLEIFISGAGLEKISEGAFLGCDSLHTVVLNEGLKTIEDISFSNCKSLKSLVIPDSVELIEFGATHAPAQDFVIIGKKGSIAEEYAKENEQKFQAN